MYSFNTFKRLVLIDFYGNLKLNSIVSNLKYIIFIHVRLVKFKKPKDSICMCNMFLNVKFKNIGIV